MVCFTSGMTCTITKQTKTKVSGNEEKTDVKVYDGIKCFEIKSSGGSLTATGLAEHTKKADKIFKVGKGATDVKIGMKATFTDGDIGDYGTYIIEDVVPIKNKGRLHALYLYCNRYNNL